MRIGILTFHFSNNFGALLQAYALRTWLIQEGYQAEFVNYHPSYVEEGRFNLTPSFDGLRTNAKSLFLQYAHLRSRLFYSPNLMGIERFRGEVLGISDQCYRSKKELEDAELPFDMLICGSDQIWNVSPQFGLDPVYFLAFESSAKQRIAYAASFGASRLPIDYQDQAASHIAALDAISVREQKGAEFASSISGRPVHCVPDPTFLLENYDDITTQAVPPSTEQLFFYVLRSVQGFPEIADALSNELNASVVAGFNPLRRWKEVGPVVSGGPLEWLAALSKSRLVVSNSFHATVFSLLLNVPFISVRLPGKRARLSERLRSVLTAVGIEDRLIDAGDVDRAVELANTEIDWAPVNRSIQSMRNCGQQYLRESLAGIETMKRDLRSPAIH